MQPLVATHRSSQRHPLFDDSSDYGRMRASSRTDLKMLGFFCLLASKAEQSGVTTPTSLRSEQALQDKAGRLQAVVIDLRELTAQVIVSGDDEIVSRTQAPAELCLVREPDGSRSVGLLLHQRALGGNDRHRAFFLMPRGKARIEQALGGRSYLDAFDPRVLRENDDIARILCAAAELEGEGAGGPVVRFARLPVPDWIQFLPPPIEEAQIVVVQYVVGSN